MKRPIKIRLWGMLAALVATVISGGLTLADRNVVGIDWWTIGGGGGSDVVGAVSLDNTIGQWIVGSNSAGNTQLVAGFWGNQQFIDQTPTPTATSTAEVTPTSPDAPTPTVTWTPQATPTPVSTPAPTATMTPQAQNQFLPVIRK